MMPTKSELKIQIPEVERQKQDAAQEDLEQGRVQPTLRVDKITSQLQSTRAQRENRLVQTFSRTTQPPSAFSPIGRQTSSIAGPLSPPSEVLEEEDIGAARPNDLEPVPELPSRVPSRVQFEESHQGWYPDDAASAITEHEGEGDLDGDWIGEHADAIPLKAYEEDTDEIHNLHTHWSVIRLRFREPLAELLAVSFSFLASTKFVY
jgi:aquaglyceroporin related protein